MFFKGQSQRTAEYIFLMFSSFCLIENTVRIMNHAIHALECTYCRADL